MLPLAHALSEAGHVVRWATAESVCVRFREEGFDAVRAGLEDPPTPTPPPEITALPPPERPNFMFAKIFGAWRAEPMLADLVPLVEEWQPAVMVCDQAELAGPIAAARSGVPNITHSFGRLLPAERLARAADEMADTWRANELETRAYPGTYDHLYIDVVPAGPANRRRRTRGGDPTGAPMAPMARADGGKPLVYITFEHGVQP